MAKLNQIVAVEKGVKGRTQRAVTDAYHKLQKAALLSGISRTYRPKDEEGEGLPSESTRVQVKAEDELRDVSTALTKLMDITATKDWGNNVAKADVVVDGTTILADVPVTYLLFLEKQLVDVHTFVAKLPVLDAAEAWRHDPASDVWRTEETQTHRTKKVMRSHVLYEATEKHPAQVESYQEDVIVGFWSTVRFSGAMDAQRVNQLLERVERLQAAVKFAREEANGVEVVDQHIGDAVFGYLLG